jgi:hypothetical protein
MYASHGISNNFNGLINNQIPLGYVGGTDAGTSVWLFFSTPLPSRANAFG